MKEAAMCRRHAGIIIAALILVAAFPANAHRTWILPSETVLSGQDVWITVDAAVSNELFVFEHRPLALDKLQIYGPNGETVGIQNPATGKYRSTFDVHLEKSGTYKLAIAGGGYTATYTLNGDRKRWRGEKADLAKAIPVGAKEVRLIRFHGRTEVYVTAGAPTKGALVPTGEGLEMVPVTHPNDLIVGEPAVFRFLDNGEPASNIAVAIVRGGVRYRDSLEEIKAVTDADGRISVTWPKPGMYWIGASTGSEKADSEGAIRRSRYSGTLEVLPQ